jgi:ribosomal RNA-processing protein 17
MFARPRPKKSLLPPSAKRRKTTSAVEEISFDFDARADYLTGFHKRKVQRAKQAQEEAAKKAKEERIAARKQVSLSLASACQRRTNNISCVRSVVRSWRRMWRLSMHFLRRPRQLV